MSLHKVDRIPTLKAPTAFEAENFKVVPHEGAKTLVILMTATGAGRVPGFFNFWESGHKLSVHRIFVNNGPRDEWYQTGVPNLGLDLADTLQNISLWARYLGAEETVFIGQSMGAYGAILLGGMYGARVLAFGPETTLKLPASRSEKLMDPSAPVIFPDLHSVISKASNPITVFAGESDPIDLYCMSLAVGLPNYVARPLRKVTHGIGGYLDAKRRFQPLLEAFVAGEQIGAMPEDSPALSMADYPRELYEMHVAHNRRRYDEAVCIGQVISSRYSSSFEGSYLLGDSLAKLGRPREALQAFSMADAIQGGRKEVRYGIGNCFRILGDIDQAIDVLTPLTKQKPEYPNPFYDLARIYDAAGLYQQAYEFAAVACTLKMKDENFRKNRDRIKRKIGSAPPSDPASIRIRAVYG